MSFEEWLLTGISSGFCFEPICNTHEGPQLSDAEIDEIEEGADPCIPVVRLRED